MTLQTMRAGGTQHPEEIMNFLTSRIVKGTGGVYDSSSGGLNVTQSGTPAMSVDVAEGFAFVRKSADDMCYPVRLYDGSETVTIASNSSGFDRIDAIVLYNNLGATANADITNVATLTVVEGTPDASPTAPSTVDIEGVIGSSNPYIVLAHVTVENAETAIVDADITDQRQEVSFQSHSTPAEDSDVVNKVYVDSEITNIDNGSNHENWHVVGESGEPAYEADWISYNTLDADWRGIEFRKEGNRCFLRGLARYQGTSSSNITIFTLPDGYRPSNRCLFIVSAESGVSRVDVEINGDVIYRSEVAHDGTGTNFTNGISHVALEGINFDIS